MCPAIKFAGFCGAYADERSGLGRIQAHAGASNSLARYAGHVRSVQLTSTVDEDDPNESRYLGRNSIAAFLSEEARTGQASADGEQDFIRKDIMPILGMQISSAPYPFMSEDHMDKIRHDIGAALPSDRDVLK
jgi:hypothetical protein